MCASGGGDPTLRCRRPAQLGPHGPNEGEQDPAHTQHTLGPQCHIQSSPDCQGQRLNDFQIGRGPNPFRSDKAHVLDDRGAAVQPRAPGRGRGWGALPGDC